jgi:hypothetical protein
MEAELFEGTPVLEHGALAVDRRGPVSALTLRQAAAQRLAA